MKNQRNKNRGFGIVEALMATAVFSIAVVASLQALKVVLPEIQTAFSSADSQVRLHSAMEEVIATKNVESVFAGLVIGPDSAAQAPLVQKLSRRIFSDDASKIKQFEFMPVAGSSVGSVYGIEIRAVLNQRSSQDAPLIIASRRYFDD